MSPNDTQPIPQSGEPWRTPGQSGPAGWSSASPAGSAAEPPPLGDAGAAFRSEQTGTYGAGPVPAPARGTSRPRRSLVTLALVAVTSGLIGGGAGAATYSLVHDDSTATTGTSSTNSLDTASTTSTTPARAYSDVEQVAAALLPSVVSIQVVTGQGAGTGTGVILSADGLILTNNHVVESAAQGGQLTVHFNDGSTASASIVGHDPVTDLALIKAKGVSGLKPAQLGSSGDLKVGEQVVAIGSPLGLQGTVTTGIVSALQRPVSTSGSGGQGTVIDAIQTDAAINPGNSGGPLVDMSGRVVGINSAIATLGSSSGESGSIGLGFSIPIDQAKRIAQELENGGTAVHAQLGVSVGDSSKPSGAVVGQVTTGSAAEAAGLRDGDVITAIGDRRLDGADSLVAAIRSEAPGDKVKISFVRGGETKTVTVTLGSDQAGT